MPVEARLRHAALVVTATLVAGPALALPPGGSAAARNLAPPPDESSEGAADAGGLERGFNVGSPYRLFAGLSLGRGLRFNNPYRLETELGRSAESLSLTATYANVELGFAAWEASGWSHGGALDASIALDGVAQEVLTPSYLVFRRLGARWLLRGRAGIPIVVEPDLNAGFEAAFGGVFRLTAGIGLTATLVGSLFYGAATYETARTTIPIASLELGVMVDYEVLP